MKTILKKDKQGIYKIFIQNKNKQEFNYICPFQAPLMTMDNLSQMHQNQIICTSICPHFSLKSKGKSPEPEEQYILLTCSGCEKKLYFENFTDDEVSILN